MPAASFTKGSCVMARILCLALACLLGLAACSEPAAPPGRWEGFSESPDWLIAVRLELQPNNTMRASALTALVTDADLPRRYALEQELKTGMKAQWPSVTKTDIDFNGKSITRREGYAPIFVYEPNSRAMIFHFYAGGKLTEKVTLRPVGNFAK
jgi:hypothetical protein